MVFVSCACLLVTWCHLRPPAAQGSSCQQGQMVLVSCAFVPLVGLHHLQLYNVPDRAAKSSAAVHGVIQLHISAVCILRHLRLHHLQDRAAQLLSGTNGVRQLCTWCCCDVASSETLQPCITAAQSSARADGVFHLCICAAQGCAT